jgi:hypothetical protein
MDCLPGQLTHGCFVSQYGIAPSALTGDQFITITSGRTTSG